MYRSRINKFITKMPRPGKIPCCETDGKSDLFSGTAKLSGLLQEFADATSAWSGNATRLPSCTVKKRSHNLYDGCGRL